MEANFFTFHKTVRGFRHIKEEIPCQDNSTSFSSQDEQCQIIAIGDGHGDPACCRSDRGSRFAVKIAESCLREFGWAVLSVEMDFSSPRQQRSCIEQLTNTIISKWRSAVRDDLEHDSVTEEDFSKAGAYEKAYKNGEMLEHMYGTTLIAALRVSNYLILLQQGDGRCDVYYEDGTVNQPIPWDERCKGSITTSLCNSDAFNSIRSAVINLEKSNVVACFIGSDGVEDSYYDNEETQLGTHRFYMDLTCKLAEYGVLNFDKYLTEMLPKFSETGSTDDVSVAGIIDICRISSQISGYGETVKHYDYVEQLKKDYQVTCDKIISMTRKHGILKENIDQIRISLDKAQTLKTSIEEKKTKTISERDVLHKAVEQAKQELELCRKETENATGQFEETKYKTIIPTIQKCMDEISNAFSTKEKEYKKITAQLNNCDIQINVIDDELNCAIEEIQSIEKKLADAESTFEEYDKTYKNLEKDKNRLENELSSLSEGDT